MREGTGRTQAEAMAGFEAPGPTPADLVRESNMINLHSALEDECPAATVISTLWDADGSVTVRVEYERNGV